MRLFRVASTTTTTKASRRAVDEERILSVRIISINEYSLLGAEKNISFQFIDLYVNVSTYISGDRSTTQKGSKINEMIG